MECTHEQIMCRNCVKICLKCGRELPSDFRAGKDAPAPEQAAETPAEPQKTARKRTTRKKGE